MLHFNPQAGVYPDDTQTVRDAVSQDWINAFLSNGTTDLNTEPETPAGQLIDAETAAITTKDSDVLYLANQFNPLTAEGQWQDALGYIYFLTRKIAEPTVVTCQLTGLMGTKIPYGAVVKNTDG